MATVRKLNTPSKSKLKRAQTHIPVEPPKIELAILAPDLAVLKDSFTRNEMAEAWDHLKDYFKPSITLSLTKTYDDYIPAGKSKIGGCPDLPQDTPWFKDKNGKEMSFLAQFNLAEVHFYDRLNFLPSSGMLYFFYTIDSDGFCTPDMQMHKVYYYDGDISDLQRQSYPQDFIPNAKYHSCSVEYKTTYDLPSEYADYICEKYTDDIFHRTEEPETITKLSGYPDIIQLPMEFDLQLEDKGIKNSDVNSLSDEELSELETKKYNWNLLFQLDSEEKAGMEWIDGGRLYFWIKTSDLQERNFDKSYATIDSY